MKQLIAITGIILLTLGINSCKNDEWSFPDFDYTTTYFPYQAPVRTLILGDYYFDNTRDNALQFLISVNSGGVYKNGQNISVDFVVDPTLTDSLYNSTTGKKMYALPPSYYTLSNTSITIPSGQPNGDVTVQLTQSFLDDTLSTAVIYVVPLKITTSTTDSILVGNPLISNPDLRIAGNWAVKPKNYTLFGIKFVNEYHGVYLLRGVDVRKDTLTGVPVDTIIYRNKYVEKSELATVSIDSKLAVSYSNSVRLKAGSPGSFKMKILFDATTGNGIISRYRSSAYKISGTAKFVKKDDANAQIWGGVNRATIFLDYVITQGAFRHYVLDTLVFRDKAIKFEEFTPLIKLAP